MRKLRRREEISQKSEDKPNMKREKIRLLLDRFVEIEDLTRSSKLKARGEGGPPVWAESFLDEPPIIGEVKLRIDALRRILVKRLRVEEWGELGGAPVNKWAGFSSVLGIQIYLIVVRDRRSSVA